MKIYLASDLHVEFHKDFFGPEKPVDVIILAGDIHIGVDSIRIAEQFQEKYGVPVIVVAGNHEFYDGDINAVLSELRAAAQSKKAIYFLENDRIEISDVRFLGCTLWSDFTFLTDRTARFSKMKAREAMNDFQIIWNQGVKFSPDDAEARFKQSHAWLESELIKPYGGDTVVVTHFAPHRSTIHPMYLSAGTDELTPYFTNDCSALIRRYPIKVWAYGHNHNSVDVIVENCTRVVSNQRGYPGEELAYTQYDPLKIIEL